MSIKKASRKMIVSRVKRSKKGSKHPRNKARISMMRQLEKKVNMITKSIETKSGVRQLPDGIEYLHNTLYTISSDFMATTTGVFDNESALGNRIGDKITLSGVAFTMMLELNERYSDVTFRMFVVRSAKGDTPTTATLWQGASGNKMLDTFNTERYSILFSKYVRARHSRKLVIRKVPGSIPAENTSPQIHMDLST